MRGSGLDVAIGISAFRTAASRPDLLTGRLDAVGDIAEAAIRSVGGSLIIRSINQTI
jgi:hypothetical protein